MRFVDEVRIIVCSGNGGAGAVSFRRERFIPKGGPDGGDGGRGGDVIFRASSEKRTLYHLRLNNQFRADSGMSGRGANRAGRAGKSLVIDLPLGTVLIDACTGCVIKDLSKEGEIFVVVNGGKGGKGNARFKSSTNRTPRFAQDGEVGSTLSLKLELKLLADIGIIGLPNAGKSTLLSAISSAKPKIGNYPFTTLTPNLGIVSTKVSEPFVVADIPGLIEGAHKGYGLGTRFLKHIERTNILIHLVDAGNIDPYDPFVGIKIVDRELLLYSKKLSIKPRLFVLNKIDISISNQVLKSFKKECISKGHDFLCISAITGEGVKHLILKLSEMVSLFSKS